MLKRVLVALDDSARATAVFDVGADFAHKYGAELYLFRTVTVPQEFPAAAASSANDPLPAYLKEAADKDLCGLAKRAPHVAVTENIITFGFPAQLILEMAEDLNVDLIVMGSHGYRGWDRVLGTTAATIANRSTRNVLIVHDPNDGSG